MFSLRNPRTIEFNKNILNGSNDFRSDLANPKISMVELYAPESRVNSPYTFANTAKSRANSPESNADPTYTFANTAKSRANTAKSRANSPESNADPLATRANPPESNADPTENGAENSAPLLRDTKRIIFDCSPRASARSLLYGND